MKTVMLSLLLSFPFLARADMSEYHANRLMRGLRAEFSEGNLQTLAERTDVAISFMVARGVKELRHKGLDAEATMFQERYNKELKGYLTNAVNAARDIGDHSPLNEFLKTFYDRLELVLGVNLCKALHLSDIKTLNFCIPVVFRPCTFSMDAVTGTRAEEYKRHFAQGAVYWGLVPVVAYWVVDISCLFGTAGIAALLCVPVSGLVEVGVGRYVAPSLSDKVFAMANCN